MLLLLLAMATPLFLETLEVRGALAPLILKPALTIERPSEAVAVGVIALTIGSVGRSGPRDENEIADELGSGLMAVDETEAILNVSA
jgi:hypothetical protein